MAQIIDMPKLSDTMTVGTLVRWLKSEGDAVKSGDMLAEVETDKATMELESFFDGILLKRFANEGDQVAIGDALCAIGEKGEKVEAPPPKPDTGKRKPDTPDLRREPNRTAPGHRSSAAKAIPVSATPVSGIRNPVSAAPGER